MNQEKKLDIKSPDENIHVTFKLKEYNGAEDCLVYSVNYKGKIVIAESQLCLNIKDDKPIKDDFDITNVSESSNDSIWEPVYGERNKIRDYYNQMVIELREKHEPKRLIELNFRVYNEGAAFCYTIKRQKNLETVHISSEHTQFCFLHDYTTWATYSAQGEYSKIKLSEIKPGCERPLTVDIAGGPYVALAEARLVDYARMKFAFDENMSSSEAKEQKYCVISNLSGEVQAKTPLTTPWRVVMIADTPGELLENNDIILNLNDPCAIEDSSWIKPGKVIREVTLTTQGGKTCVDFAVKHNLQYVEFDAGWYGAENSEESDASFVSVDRKRSDGPLDLQEVIKYADERDIGIILYVNHKALEQQLDEILPIYKKWGIKGIKFGFVNVGSQRWTSWLHEAIRKTADYQMMADVHDEYRPTGYSRTYPNFMTQEGIRGDEAKPRSEQTLTILFSRMLAGAGDNTVCYFDARVDQIWSHAYQLAKAVCFYSPLQFLYWYDRPEGSPGTGGAGGQKPGISEEPELGFFDHISTVWDDTLVLHGEVGKYATVARRKANNWFIGSMNSDTSRTLEIPLTFLDEGKQYVAHIYSDDPTIETRAKVRIDRYLVDVTTVLKADLKPNTGQAVRIVPVTPKDSYPHTDQLKPTKNHGL